MTFPIYGKIKLMFQTTNQYINTSIYWDYIGDKNGHIMENNTGFECMKRPWDVSRLTFDLLRHVPAVGPRLVEFRTTWESEQKKKGLRCRFWIAISTRKWSRLFISGSGFPWDFYGLRRSMWSCWALWGRFGFDFWTLLEVIQNYSKTHPNLEFCITQTNHRWYCTIANAIENMWYPLSLPLQVQRNKPMLGSFTFLQLQLLKVSDRQKNM